MKKIFLTLGIAALTITAFSQTDPRCPELFRRNNGNALGCDASILLQFPTCPTVPVYVVGVEYNGALVPGLTFQTSGCNNGRLIVCINGSNIPQAGLIGLHFSIFPNGPAQYACFNDGTGGPTPVSLSSFQARRNNSKVNLSWSTEFEMNLKEFVIQRKTGNTFQDIAKITPSNDLNGSNYTFADNNGQKNSSQYRLKIIDLDGTEKISDIRNVKGMGGAMDFIVFPNPSQGKVKITVTDMTDPFDVEVIDNSGRLIRTIHVTNQNEVEINNIPKGMHLVRIINKNTGETVTQKLTVVN